MRRDLPSGTVTFLFTDVEGSTKLLQELGAEAYAEALLEHRRVLREAFDAHDGVEVDTQGDAFFVAFPTALGALAAAAAALEGLSTGPIRVRMGVHTGTPHVDGEGYVGVDVHRAARIAAAGHGGQVLVSAATAALLDTDSLRDLGEHRLKDMSAPERIYQLGNVDFPPLRTLNATNLPVAANELVGREGELAELVSLFRDGSRLVTVTGPGGTGKTRFALQGAAALVDEFEDGVFWVALQALSDPMFVLPTVAQTLGAGDDLAGYLRSRRTLVLLDNFEHLTAAAPALAQLRAVCPELRVLVTSRAPLRIAGEHEFPLDPLPERDARTLFVQRARDVGRRLEPDETVAAICHRLDNLPLALELAAARTKVLDTPALLARLERTLPLLTDGRRDAPERQQTLRATIDWSYELLDDQVKRLFARLAVFAGSFSLESAEQICDADLDGLATLVDVSMLKVVRAERFLMLETIAEYARERLEKSDDSKAMRGRHAEHFLALIRRGAAHDEANFFAFSRRPPSKDELDALETDYDNVRAALDWLRLRGEVERELVLTHALASPGGFLNIRGRPAEARPMLEAVLSRAGGADPALRSGALASLSMFTADIDRKAALRSAAESVDLARRAGERDTLQRALRTLARYQEDPHERRRMLLECEALAREDEDPWSLAFVQMLLGKIALAEGEYAEARLRLEEELAIFEGLGNEIEIARALTDVGFLAVAEGRQEEARSLFGEALRRVLELGVANYASVCLEGLAAVALVDAPDVATRLLGAASAIREANQDNVVEDYERSILDRMEAAARAQLGPRFNSEWEAGRALTLDQAASLVLDGAD
jgi:predicted ATPase/class 3 adenylate cyclase